MLGERGKAAGPNGIMNEMLKHAYGWLVEVMLLMMNVVMKSECYLLRLKERSTGTSPQRW